MTTLAVDTPRTFELGDMNDIGAIASDIIYEGAAVGDDGNGYARPLVAGDKFLGFCLEQCDNSTGSAGDKKVHVRVRGRARLSVGSLAITDVGKAVYASDDNAFTLTASTNSYVGVVVRYISSGVGIVSFDATRGGLGSIGAALTDSTGGTANDTLAAVGATNSGDVSGVINSNFADIAAKLNAIIKMLND